MHIPPPPSFPLFIAGLDTGNVRKSFPEDGVEEVGSNLTFCCIWPKGERLKKMQYSGYPIRLSPPIRLSNWSTLIRVPNVNKSNPSGDNMVCYLDPPDIIGTVVNVGCKYIAGKLLSP